MTNGYAGNGPGSRRGTNALLQPLQTATSVICDWHIIFQRASHACNSHVCAETSLYPLPKLDVVYLHGALLHDAMCPTKDFPTRIERDMDLLLELLSHLYVVLTTNLSCSNHERAKRLHPTLQGPTSDNYNRIRTARDAQRDLHHQHLQEVTDPPTERHAIGNADITTCSQLAYLPPAPIRKLSSTHNEAEVRA